MISPGDTTAATPIVSATLHLPRAEGGRALVAHCAFCETDHHHGAADHTRADVGKITSRGAHCIAEAASPYVVTGMSIRIDGVATTAATEGYTRNAHPIVTDLGWRLWQRLGAPDRAAIRAEGRKSHPNGPGYLSGWNGSALRREVVAAILGRAGGWSSERIHLGYRIGLDGWSRWSIDTRETSRRSAHQLGEGGNLLSLLSALSGWSIPDLAREILQNVDGSLAPAHLDRVSSIIGEWIDRGSACRRVDHIEPVAEREWIATGLAHQPPGFGNYPGIENPPHEIKPASVCRSAGIRIARKAVLLAVPGRGFRADPGGAHSLWVERYGCSSSIVIDGTETSPHGLVDILATLYGLPRGLVVLRLLEAATGVRLDATAAFELMEMR